MREICFCGKDAKYNVLLFVSENEDGSPRWYIPNQSRRMVPELLKEIWFCSECMRVVEDGFRDVITNYLAGNRSK